MYSKDGGVQDVVKGLIVVLNHIAYLRSTYHTVVDKVDATVTACVLQHHRVACVVAAIFVRRKGRNKQYNKGGTHRINFNLFSVHSTNLFFFFFFFFFRVCLCDCVFG